MTFTGDGHSEEHQPAERGTGQFPPDAACVCGVRDAEPCLGRDHTTRWDEASGEFKGTRCDRHGGHKFEPYGGTDLEREWLDYSEDPAIRSSTVALASFANGWGRAMITAADPASRVSLDELAGLFHGTPQPVGRAEAALLAINHDLRALVVTAGTMLTMEQTRDKMRDLADRAQSALESSP